MGLELVYIYSHDLPTDGNGHAVGDLLAVREDYWLRVHQAKKARQKARNDWLAQQVSYVEGTGGGKKEGGGRGKGRGEREYKQGIHIPAKLCSHNIPNSPGGWRAPNRVG